MHIYDTLIVGSGYTSVGYAVSRQNCIICEKTELCDTHFGAALFSFLKTSYQPCTDHGKRLLEIYAGLNLFENGMQNANAFECGFCKYILENNVEILLKCRVTDKVYKDGVYEVNVMTNSGFEKIYAKHIKDFSNEGRDYIKVLFESHDIENDVDKLKNVFGDINFEKAFYDNRYALDVPSLGMDINCLKLYIYGKWSESGTKAKILHVPSAMFAKGSEKKCDQSFESFIEAFEFGISEGMK